MYKNLVPKALGIACRQSELIELALTHKFGDSTLICRNFKNKLSRKGWILLPVF